MEWNWAARNTKSHNLNTRTDKSQQSLKYSDTSALCMLIYKPTMITLLHKHCCTISSFSFFVGFFFLGGGGGGVSKGKV